MKRFLFVVGAIVVVAGGLVAFGALQHDPAARQAAHGLGVVGRPLAHGWHLAVDPVVTATSGNAGAALIGGLITFAAGQILFSSLRGGRPMIIWLAVSTAVGLALYLPSTARTVKHTWTAAPAVVVTAVR